MIQELENEWKTQQKRLSTEELLLTFPQAVPIVKEQIKLAIASTVATVDAIAERKKFWRRVPWSEKWLADEALKELIEEENLINKKLRGYAFKLILIRNLKAGRAVDKSFQKQLDIGAAKAVPIETFFTGKLSKRGQRAIGLCPFHPEKTPSFTIYLLQNTYWCYACNTGGDVIEFVMKQQKLPFVDAVKFILNQ
jgi:hypothetical protein